MEYGSAVLKEEKAKENKIHGMRKKIAQKYWMGWAGSYSNSKKK